VNALENQLRINQMPWRRCMSFIEDIQISPSPLLVELVVKKGGDVTNANIRHHLPIDGIHP
jgi:hypothetical protein